MIKLLLKVVNQEEPNPLHQKERGFKPLISVVRKVVERYYHPGVAYGAVLNEESSVHNVLVYFPTIVKDNDPIFRRLTQDLISLLNRSNPLTGGIYGEMRWNDKNVMFEHNPDPVTFHEALCSEGCEEVSEDTIFNASDSSATPNAMSQQVDRFDMLLEYFREIHKTDDRFFLKNIRIVCCAFFRQRDFTSYSERSDNPILVEDWLVISREFGVEDKLAGSYFKQIEDFSYTTVTMEEVIRRKSAELYDKIDNYNAGRLRYAIRNLILQQHVPSQNELWRVFAEFLRRDHFYHKGLIYVFKDNRCVEREPKDLRPVANKFVCLLREGKVTLEVEALQNGRDFNETEVDKRITEIVKPFENSTSVKFMENACSNYLELKLRTAIRRTAIPFKDVVLIYDPEQKELTNRKAYMEDQFTSTAPVTALGFHRTEAQLRSIEEVKLTLMRMFNNRQNVDWFIRWMGSLLLHVPERVCLIILGPKGKNGKTHLMKALAFVLGEFACNCNTQILMKAKGSTTCTPFEMELKDKVLAVISETDRSMKYSSSILKEMTGGDPKTGAKKFKDAETFDQTAKIVILCNHMPGFDEVDEALADRSYIILSTGRFVHQSEVDHDKEMYLGDHNFWNEDRKQALAWIMIHEGYKAYMEQGLQKTPSQINALSSWQIGSNPYKTFAECCKERFKSIAYLTQARNVYEIYCQRNKIFSGLSFAEFKEKFAESTGYRTSVVDDEEYYPFYHDHCNVRFPEGEMR